MNAKSLFANFKATSFSRIATAGLSFVLFWWLARNLPSDHVGGFALAMGIYYTAQTLPLLGLHLSLVKTTATRSGDLQSTVNTHWWFALPIALLMAAALVAYAISETEGAIEAALVLMAATMLPTSWTTVAEATLVGLEKMGRLATTGVAEAVWRLVGSVVALNLGGALPAVVAVFLIGRVGTALYYLGLPELPRPSLQSPPARAALAALWKLTPVYLGITLLAAVSTRFDILALGHLVELSEVGKYSAGAKIYEAVLMVPTLAAFVVLPSLARLHLQDPQQFTVALSVVLRAVLVVGLPLALIGAEAAPWIVGLVFPAGFSDAAPVVQVLLFAAVLATLDIVLSSTMVASNAQNVDFRCMAVALVVLVVAMFVLVPHLGIIGAALAVFINMATRVIYRLVWATKAIGAQGVWPALVKACAASAIAWYAATHVPGLPWPVATLGALLVYLALALGSGLIEFAHLRLIPRTIHSALDRVR